MTELLRISRVPEQRASWEPRLIKWAAQVYSDLQSEASHPPPCCCPACLFKQYRSKPRGAGQQFGRDTFFWDWLSFEIKLSMVKITTAYVGEELIEKSYINRHELFRVRGYIPKMIEFLKKYRNRFPLISNLNPGRIKLALWRFQKSGILLRLEKEIALQDPTLAERGKAAIPFWDSLHFAQRVSDFIKARPGKRASYREILRHFSNKRKADIDGVLWALSGNYQMRPAKLGASMILAYSPPAVEQVKAYNQRIAQEIIDDENKLFGDEKN